MRYLSLTIGACLLMATTSICQETVEVRLEPKCVRSIGGTSRFRREQFITIHASPDDKDMTEADWDFLLNDLEVSFGRDGGSRSWHRKITPADPERPDFPELDALRQNAEKAKQERHAAAHYSPERWREMILCTHPETYYARPDNKAAAWGPRTIEAAAEFTANLMKEFYEEAERPRYLEVFNEPFVKLRHFGGNVDDAAKQHVAVAKRVRRLCPNVLVGGYTAAYPEMEIRDFQHWTNWMKRFIDIAGSEMDFFSTHIYDGVNVEGTPRQRTGSNSQAITDLIDAYSHIALGEAKPQIISEFGLIPTGKGTSGLPYTAECAGRMIHATNAQLMTFMDHPDRFIKVTPFILTKGGWTYNLPGCSEETPYPFLLWRKQGKEYLLTDLALFYRFWKGVNGEWRASQSSNPDLRCHMLADGDRLVVILCNLDGGTKQVNLSGLAGIDARQVTLRRLRTLGTPALADTPLGAVPESLELSQAESAMLIIDAADPIRGTELVHEYRRYATTYLQEIEAGTPIRFEFKDVPVGKGTATLRLGIGREQGKSLKPVVRLASKALDVPTNWAGGDQSGRNSFLGMIEVPVPMELVTANPAFEIVFPDSGGKVASAVLQVNRLEEGVSPVGMSGKWKLVEDLSDEFNVQSVDDERWDRQLAPWGERAWRAENVYQRDGSLRIRARYEPHENKGRKFFYTMGILRSRKTTTYGYFEARVKGCSKFRGMCPGFWLFSTGKHRQLVDGETVCYSEIDIFELQQGLWSKDLNGLAPVNRIDCNLHVRLLKDGKETWFRPNNAPEMCQNHWDAPWDPRDDYHVYGVENSKEWIVWYIDGKEVARKKNLYWHLPMHLTLTMEARPPLIRWAGVDGREPDPENCTPDGFPTEMSIDYVRAWVRAE
jgi:hypothetical protein